MIPPMIVHAYCESESLDVYHILIKKEFVEANRKEAGEVSGFLQLVEIEPFVRQHCSDRMFLHLLPNQLMQLKSDLNIIDENAFDGVEIEPLKNHIVWKILYIFSTLLYNQIFKKDKNLAKKYDIEILKILEYIHKNYEDKLTIDLLCKKAFLSRSTFLRSFHNVCGCSPMEYVSNYRCKIAMEMIDNSCLSKTEIANHCGFYDLSHMERTIKRLSQ